MSLTLPLIALGGAAGSVLRYLMATAIGAPLGTAAVNVLGSFVIGLLFILLGREGWQVLLMTGLLGGFTTFSAFSLDAVHMRGRGAWGALSVYALGSVAASIAALMGGLYLGKLMA